MYSNGDTYVVRGVPKHNPRYAPPPPASQVDGLVAILSERVNHLEATVRRLDTAVTTLEAELREARAQSPANRAATRPVEFRTEQPGQSAWFPGATPRSGSALRAARASRDPFATIYTDADINP